MSNPINIYLASYLIWYFCKYEVNFEIWMRFKRASHTPWNGEYISDQINLGWGGGVEHILLGALSEILSRSYRRSFLLTIYFDLMGTLLFFDIKAFLHITEVFCCFFFKYDKCCISLNKFLSNDSLTLWHHKNIAKSTLKIEAPESCEKRRLIPVCLVCTG